MMRRPSSALRIACGLNVFQNHSSPAWRRACGSGGNTAAGAWPRTAQRWAACKAYSAMLSTSAASNGASSEPWAALSSVGSMSSCEMRPTTAAQNNLAPSVAPACSDALSDPACCCNSGPTTARIAAGLEKKVSMPIA
eukprot:3863377-Rhodomonas_salina.17